MRILTLLAVLHHLQITHSESSASNGSQMLDHLTVMETENVFLGETAPGAPNCTEILELSVRQAAGLVNYRCAPAKKWSRSGLKCCSFGEKYTEAAHRHSHSQLARQIVRPAQRKLLNKCTVTDQDSKSEVLSWCVNEPNDLCFDLSPAENHTLVVKGCVNDQLPKDIITSALLQTQPSESSRPQLRCYNLTGYSPAFADSILCLCTQQNCNRETLALDFRRQLSIKSQLLAENERKEREKLEKHEKLTVITDSKKRGHIKIISTTESSLKSLPEVFDSQKEAQTVTKLQTDKMKEEYVFHRAQRKSKSSAVTSTEEDDQIFDDDSLLLDDDDDEDDNENVGFLDRVLSNNANDRLVSLTTVLTGIFAVAFYFVMAYFGFRQFSNWT